MQFTEVLDLPYGRHVKAILELADFDLLYGDLATSRELSTWLCRSASTQHDTTQRKKKKDNPDKRPHKYPLQLSGLSPCWQYVLRTPSLRGTRGHAPSVLSLCVGPLHCIHESSERSLRYSDVTGRTYADTYKLEATHDKRYTPL